MATVLVVDDDLDVREMLRTSLRGDGHYVVGIASARQARDMIPSLEPDVVILDQHLEDGMGLELCRLIFEQDWNTSVFFFSGDADVKAAAFEAGAAGFFLKGVDTLAQIALGIEQAPLMRAMRSRRRYVDSG